MNDGGLRRDAAWVTREYGREKWPRVEAAIREAIATDDMPQLGRVLRTVARWEASQAGSPLSVIEGLVGGTRVVAPVSAMFGAHRDLIVETTAALAGPDTDLIVELGSGWARNVLSVWLGGGPASALYVGAEFTAAGRRCGELLAGLESRLRFLSLDFDYGSPDLSALPRARRAVVFTAHSIEQIPVLSPSVLDAITGVADRVDCVHFEPVAWQSGPSEGSSEAYAAAHDYNRNLVEVLQELERQGRLRVNATVGDAVGVNPDNATSVIVWHAGA